MKRKRKTGQDLPRKRTVGDQPDTYQAFSGSNIDHPVLSSLYAKVVTLRQYVLSKLPESSRKRKRTIANFGYQREDDHLNDETELSVMLDTLLVGLNCENGNGEGQARERAFVTFSQLPESTIGSDVAHGSSLQPEVVDFVIWLLFKKHPGLSKPPHILCHGYQRACAAGQNGLVLSAAPAIPGLLSHYPNANVETIKGPLWCQLLGLLGSRGERVMMDLLLDCGVFSPIKTGDGNFHQLSGVPLSEMKNKLTLSKNPGKALPNTLNHCPKQTTVHGQDEVNKAASIKFVRSRMLYARAALNAKGGVRFGLRHIHVLNRFVDTGSVKETVHVMKYIFPRQFGLHNVFTSKVDPRETAQPLKDYTLREQEIIQAQQQRPSKKANYVSTSVQSTSSLPKRLRSQPAALVRKLRVLHQRCSYTMLLQHYCPISASTVTQKGLPPIHKDSSTEQEVHLSADLKTTQRPDNICFTDLATASADVSAFCRAVISKVIPNDFWGGHRSRQHNKLIVMHHIDRFVCLRRFESLTLHEVLQRLKINDIPWLRPPHERFESKMSRTDYVKRHEILMEFIYYLFDSFLIPLIRSNFHVTESNVHKNRLFYFRHDVWRRLAEPCLQSLKASMFEEMPAGNAERVLAARPIGFSQIRLLPKNTGARPITNLRRRVQIRQTGRIVLGRSINSVLTPIFNVLKYEKGTQPHRLGSSLFSVGDMYPKLKGFRAALDQRGLANAPLYFAKVDVQSCFDTIPQSRLLQVVESLLSVNDYRIGRHTEVKPPERHQYNKHFSTAKKTSMRFVSHGRAAGDFSTFEHLVREEFSNGKNHTVFVDTVVQQTERKRKVLELLKEHITRNIVKIGKKFYRQKEGIPQGSILSSLLCNFFYAELETDCLAFALTGDSLLLRLIDDFLLISVDRGQAEKFLRTMHGGVSAYGVAVKPGKSLVNFDAVVQGTDIQKIPPSENFPYCGLLIDPGSLNISKDRQMKSIGKTVNSLTVDFTKVPGQTFHRKALNALKIQLHGMFLDTSFNALPTVLSNLYQSFLESASRSYEYIKSLPQVKQPTARVLIKTVDDLIALAVVLMRKRRRNKAHWETYECAVRKSQAKWLACRAWEEVFQRKQTKFSVLLAWLGSNKRASRPTCRTEAHKLERAVGVKVLA